MSYDFWGERAKKNKPAEPARPNYSRGPWWANPDEPPTPNDQVSRSLDYIKERYGGDGLTPEEAAIVEASTASAKTVRKSKGNCPECGSRNYASLGMVTSEHGSFENKQCFDCGYPVRHDGVPGRGSVVQGAAYHARQTNSGGKVINNYHPQNTAAGRLG